MQLASACSVCIAECGVTYELYYLKAKKSNHTSVKETSHPAYSREGMQNEDESEASRYEWELPPVSNDRSARLGLEELALGIAEGSIDDVKKTDKVGTSVGTEPSRQLFCLFLWLMISCSV